MVKLLLSIYVFGAACTFSLALCIIGEARRHLKFSDYVIAIVLALFSWFGFGALLKHNNKKGSTRE